MLLVKADLAISLALSSVCLDSARVWLSCQAIKWISVLAGLCWVLANPVTNINTAYMAIPSYLHTFIFFFTQNF